MDKNNLARSDALRCVAIQECSARNNEIGYMWIETAIFPLTATVADVFAWCDGFLYKGGKLYLSLGEQK